MGHLPQPVEPLLKHARQIEATPQVIHRNVTLPPSLGAAIGGDDERKAA
jgi:hypothetical protein